MTYHLSFQEYLDLNEAGLLKRWQNRIMGRSDDDDGKSSVATAHAMRHKDDLAGAASGTQSLIGNAASLAGNVATGNILGAAKSIWDLISDAVSTGTKAYKVGKAGMYIIEIKKHMAALKQHLLDNEQLEEETADAIIDAVFEVDANLFSEEDITHKYWAEGTKRFAAGLALGYENIQDKIFAAVMAQVIKEWVEKMGGKVEGMKDAVLKLRGEKKQKIDFLNEPEVQEAMAEFDPPRVEKDLEDEVKQPAAGTPRTLPQLQAKLIKQMGWPRLPKNGDKGFVRYRGEHVGEIQLDNPLGEWDLNVIKNYGWDEYLKNWIRMRGRVIVKSRGYADWPVSFGYDAKFEDLPKWDAANNQWIVYADYD